jgi:hypothetical protein
MKSGKGDDKDALGADVATSQVAFEKTVGLPLTFAPGANVFEFTLKTPGTPVQDRPDIGIGTDDIKLSKAGIAVTVHSLGARPAPAGEVELVDGLGKVVASVATPALEAPTDLRPHTATVKLTVPAHFDMATGRVQVSLGEAREITRMNNTVALKTVQ